MLFVTIQHRWLHSMDRLTWVLGLNRIMLKMNLSKKMIGLALKLYTPIFKLMVHSMFTTLHKMLNLDPVLESMQQVLAQIIMDNVSLHSLESHSHHSQTI